MSWHKFYIRLISFCIINRFYAIKFVKSNDFINKINISPRACLVSVLALNKKCNFIMKKYREKIN